MVHQQKQRVSMQVLLGIATQLQSKQVFRVKMSHFQYTTCITRLLFCNVASFALKNVLEYKLPVWFYANFRLQHNQNPQSKVYTLQC